MIRVAVIDAGIGNFPSLVSAFLRADVEAAVVKNPGELDAFDAAVLPGVGHWSQASHRLSSSGWSEAIVDFSHRGGRLLGVCLGMQLLGLSSDEGEGPGLGLIQMRTSANPSQNGRTENIGWNRVELLEGHKDWFGVDNGRAFYFTHKFSVAAPSLPTATLQSMDFAGAIAAVQSANIVGVQFHPERSGKSGIDFLSNIAKWASS